MVEAVKEGFRNYAIFYGRASRRQFWMWMLSLFLIGLIGGVIVLLLFVLAGVSAGTGAQDGNFGSGDWLLTGVWGLALLGVGLIYLVLSVGTIVPQLAFEARRLHDANISAWWLLLHLIPGWGTLAILIMCLLPSKPQSLYENEGRPRSSIDNSWNSSQASTSKPDDWT